MGVVLGIDVGGSTTKIVGFRKGDGVHTLLEPQFVRAADPVTSVYGALGKFTVENGLALSDIETVMMSGVGASHITKPLHDLPCRNVPEFRAIGLGGLYLSGLDEAVVISMGTGTAAVYARRGSEMEYLGGTGVGGGTLIGLSKLLLKMDSIQHVQQLAAEGDLHRVDLCIGDIAKNGYEAEMPVEMTASNFGKVSDIASRSDIALGLLNMVFETVGMIAIFAARTHHIRDIVLTGNLTTVDYCHKVFRILSGMFNVNFIIPDRAQFGTVIGTALCGL